ncbi:WD40 repeat domain-containing protein [Dactylosporangium sp. CA-092794]|uniref:WD40 repeat domain-containing protein n=1 Tax=Dactylosporangium sp. CA-092794 TaxID=3239929 RepID=UPI003D910086
MNALRLRWIVPAAVLVAAAAVTVFTWSPWSAGVITGATAGPTLTGHTDIVNDVAFSPDGTTLASGSADT